jgi:Ni,Fe-hydrogenase III small subunit
MSLLRKIRRTGRVAEPATSLDKTEALPGARPFHGSVQVRAVDAGSCNGCELEIASAFGPVYDAERFGVRLVASPRHADVLCVTGPVTHNMATPLVKTYEAAGEPKLVVAVGDCARNCGVFAGGYGVAGPVSDFVPVDLEIPGCPPSPDDLLRGLRRLTGR